MPQHSEAVRGQPVSSGLLENLRVLGDTAFWDVESAIGAGEAISGIAAAVMLLLLLIPLLGYLYSSIPVWLFALVFFWSIVAVMFVGWSFSRYIGQSHWSRFNAEYDRAASALVTTDLALIIADGDLGECAYSRMCIALPPKWISGVNEPLERHVERAAQHFDSLVQFVDPLRASAYWPLFASEKVPKRIALIALTDFFLGCDSRMWRGRYFEPPEPVENYSELGDLLLKVKPGLTDIGGQVRMRRQNSELQ